MPGEQTRTFWCLVDRDYAPFEVTIRESAKIDHLKRAIKGMKPSCGVDASNLMLWKLTKPEPVDPEDTLLQRIASRGDVATFAERLPTTKKLSEIFPQHPPEDHVHVLVQVPSTMSRTLSHSSVDGKTRSQRPLIPGNWSPRRDTVRYLYEALLKEKLVHVRGTPGCGKTTLMRLLQAHILEHDPEAFVCASRHWPRETVQSEASLDLRLKIVDPAYPRSDGRAFLLFDDGQELYKDELLWNTFLKDVADGASPLYCVILFCRYGSPSSRPVSYEHGKPLALNDSARISMWPAEESIGILLNRSEFDEVVSRFDPPLNLHPDLKDLIFDWTVGHAGAIIQLLRLVSQQKISRQGKQSTVAIFHEDYPTHSLVKRLQGGPFGRGLPMAREISADMAALFRELLKDGDVKAREDENQTITKCHRHGWIYSDPIKRVETTVRYTLPSPLHTVCISWMFEPTNEMPQLTSVYRLSRAVITKFKPSQLHLPIRRAGVQARDPSPEAQYQDEFYRSVFAVSFGNVRISPEFASAKGAQVAGRIDFFIPAVKWGIEITRDGSRLDEHSSRFANTGTYGAWLQSNDMTDYILLDFRTKIPVKAHPNIPKLFRVVFQNDYREVSFYDNQARKVEGPITLAENHHD